MIHDILIHTYMAQGFSHIEQAQSLRASAKNPRLTEDARLVLLAQAAAHDAATIKMQKLVEEIKSS